MRKNRMRLRGFDLIYFIHIPKTGGMSLIKAVSSVIHKSQMLHVPFDIRENYTASADPLKHPALASIT